MFLANMALGRLGGDLRMLKRERRRIRRKRQWRRRRLLLQARSRRARIGTTPTIRRCAMASTNVYPQAPVPQAPIPPPYRYRRSIAGPLVLIVIGLVFLLRNMGVRLPIWHWFGHWWPLLLILWGVIRLVEHSIAQREGYR